MRVKTHENNRFTEDRWKSRVYAISCCSLINYARGTNSEQRLSGIDCNAGRLESIGNFYRAFIRTLLWSETLHEHSNVPNRDNVIDIRIWCEKTFWLLARCKRGSRRKNVISSYDILALYLRWILRIYPRTEFFNRYHGTFGIRMSLINPIVRAVSQCSIHMSPTMTRIHIKLHHRRVDRNVTLTSI